MIALEYREAVSVGSVIRRAEQRYTKVDVRMSS